jgi:hypothetical protein
VATIRLTPLPLCLALLAVPWPLLLLLLLLLLPAATAAATFRCSILADRPLLLLLLLGLMPAASTAPVMGVLLLQLPAAAAFQPLLLLLLLLLLCRRLLLLLVLHCRRRGPGCGHASLLVAAGVAGNAPAVCQECIWAWEGPLMKPGVVQCFLCCDSLHGVILQHPLQDAKQAAAAAAAGALYSAPDCLHADTRSSISNVFIG